MTLTLEKFKNIDNQRKIIVVDVEENIIEKIKENTEMEIELITHKLDSKDTEKKEINERMREVEILLKKYQSAHLVITTRLHVALPCLALDTPVILLHKNIYDNDRLGDFFHYFMNHKKYKRIRPKHLQLL